jgi:hypothetical protein
MPAIDHFPDWNEALREYRTTEAPAVRASFEARLRDAFFVVGFLMPQADSDGMGVGRMIAATNNGNMLIYFTSEERIPESDNTAELSATVFTFQELYEEMLRDKSMAGVVINPNREGNTKNALILTRREVNRIADLARDAGQDMEAREMSYSIQTGNAWPPELQQALAEALSGRIEAREAYIIVQNVLWREYAPEFLFLLDIESDGTDELFGFLSEIVKPHLGDTYFRFEKLTEDYLQKIRALAPPVYLRPDVSDKAETVNSGVLPFNLFKGWDAKVTSYQASLKGVKKPRVRAEFESKLYASHLYVPLDADNNPKIKFNVQYGPLLLAFTDWKALAKCFKPGLRVAVWPFPAVYAAITRYTKVSGMHINSGEGARSLFLPREYLDHITHVMTGQRAVYMPQEHRITPAKSVPQGLADELSVALRQYAGVRAVYFMEASDGGKSPVPLLIVDMDGSENIIFPVVAGAARRVLKSAATFALKKADAKLLKTARAAGPPLYARGA